MIFRRVVTLGALGIATTVLTLGLATLVPRSAAAESAVGTVTGRVVWGTTCGPFPMPMVPDGADPSTPGAPAPAPTPPGAGLPDSSQGQAAPGGAPFRRGGLPAGAVLVAVQGTSASTRTDESGSFSIANAPAGQYLTVAAGPVSGIPTAWVARPNVLVSAGQTVDVGALPIGSSGGFPCRGLATGQGDAVPGVPDTSP